MTNSWGGDQTILRIQRLQKKNKLQDTLAKAVTNKKRSKKCSKNKEGTPQGTCTKYDFAF